MTVWLIRRTDVMGGLLEVRPVLLHRGEWLESQGRMLAYSIAGARALIPAGMQWQRTSAWPGEEPTEWWSSGPAILTG